MLQAGLLLISVFPIFMHFFLSVDLIFFKCFNFQINIYIYLYVDFNITEILLFFYYTVSHIVGTFMFPSTQHKSLHIYMD